MRYVEPGPVVEHDLPRGDVTEGVVRVGDTVRRPYQPWSPAVAAYLHHLAAAGFTAAPRHLGWDASGRDVLDYLPGDVAGAVLPAWAAADRLLDSVARLLRRLHDAGADYVPDPTLPFMVETTGRPAPAAWPGTSQRLVSHNDVTPQNTVVRGGLAVGLVDYDLAGWTTRHVDLANTAMWWVPLQDPQDRDPEWRDLDVVARLRSFVEAYGLPAGERTAFLDACAERFARSWASMLWNAENLGGGWARMWSEGVGDVIRRRIAWFATVRGELATAIDA